MHFAKKKIVENTLLLSFGGDITLFHCSIPVQGSQDDIARHHIRETLKGACWCILLMEIAGPERCQQVTEAETPLSIKGNVLK